MRKPCYINLEQAREVLAEMGVTLTPRQMKRAADKDAQDRRKLPFFIDPIEKKPFFHAFPGHEALSFGMLGCDLHCGYCQNWVTSQALRDEEAISDPQLMSGA